jgi:hypothetical protein
MHVWQLSFLAKLRVEDLQCVHESMAMDLYERANSVNVPFSSDATGLRGPHEAKSTRNQLNEHTGDLRGSVGIFGDMWGLFPRLEICMGIENP